MSDEPRVWVLNLEAEHELEARGRFTASAHVRAIATRESQRLIGNLVRPGDLVLDPDRSPDPEVLERAAGLPGLAWCPTPNALRLLEGAGARLPHAPTAEVLRTVNARPFATAVRTPLAEQAFAKHVAHTLEESLHVLAQPASEGWLVRRTFGAAGRGRRRLRCGPPTSEELAWLAASLRLGPLVVEPWVEVLREYTRSGWVHANGDVQVAPPCFQETTATGAWKSTEAAGRGEVPRGDDAVLGRAVETAGRALAEQGYFGAFGVDAFRYRLDGREALNPISEINARFTMDWTVGMIDAPERGEPRGAATPRARASRASDE